MRRIVLSLIVICLVFSTMAWATTPLGGNGLIHTHAAKTLPKGHLQFLAGTRYFGKVSSFGATNDAYTLWNVQGFSSLNLGITPNWELAISPVIYQDTNNLEGNALDGQANIPDDLYISAKLGSFGALESPFQFGGLLSLRVPMAEAHNIIYEPYSAGGMEFQIMGLASYYSNLVFPEDGWSLHANLGYLNHNDVGKELTENSKPNSMSSELLFNVGMLFPAGSFDFSAEISSRYFLSEPPVTAYSREYVSYMTAGIYYKPYPFLTFEMGIDLRLFTGEESTDFINTTLAAPPEDFPNYPSWRGIFGVKLAILPTSLYKTSERSSLQRQATDRRQILERMMKEDTDTKEAESEISRIRAERAKVESELQRLRKLLEAEKKKEKK